MEAKIISMAEGQAAITARWGDLHAKSTLAELVRTEVSARGTCTRWSMLKRLETALSPHAPAVGSAQLAEVCSALESEGDLSVSSGGRVHATPLRVIEVEAHVLRLVCSLPEHRLRAALPGELVGNGIRRTLRCVPSDEPALRESVMKLGGAWLTPEAWAGLDMQPRADGTWLENLEARLTWQSEAAGSRERDGPLDWSGLVVTQEDGLRWRRNPESARLWRARSPWGRWVWAWTQLGGSPSTDPFVSLWADDASRTVFAVALASGAAVRGTVARAAGEAWVHCTERLPRPEYRFLSMASSAQGDQGGSWQVPKSRLGDVMAILTDRLGLVWSSEGDA